MKRSLVLLVAIVLGASGYPALVRGQEEAVAKPVEPTAQPEAATTEGEKPAATQSVLTNGKPGKGQPALQPLTLTLEFSNGKALSGTLLDVTEWPMKTSFGATSLPLSTVAGIRFAQEGNATTTVVLHNGDSITGAIEVEKVDLETEWGKATINAPHITSLLFTPGLKWASEKGLNGERWHLVEATEKDVAEAAQASYTTPRVSPSAATATSAAQSTEGSVVPASPSYRSVPQPALAPPPVFNNGGGTVIRRALPTR